MESWVGCLGLDHSILSFHTGFIAVFMIECGHILVFADFKAITFLPGQNYNDQNLEEVNFNHQSLHDRLPVFRYFPCGLKYLWSTSELHDRLPLFRYFSTPGAVVKNVYG